MSGFLTCFDRMWADLEPIGRVASGGYQRFAWTREDNALREWFAGECAARGLDLTHDRMGNQWAWWGDPDAAARDGRPGVLAGSHLDSVPDGGAYDGPLGVVGALAAVDALRESGFVPTRPIGVVNFGDEEGARFGVACAGSRVISGALGAEKALGLTDADGVTMGEALRSAGRSTAIGRDDETLSRIGDFVELHVEQGLAMADPERYDPSRAAGAVGTDIWPHGRWRLDFEGTANHAGTTRLADRDDAMVTCAAAITDARRLAAQHGCVATVGKLQVTPNGVNAIPSHVTAWLDARGADEAAVLAMVAEFTEQVAGSVAQESWTPTTRFDGSLAGRLHGVLGGIPGNVPMLGTGAGHDAGILANAGVRTGMLFVRNPTGVSHSPAEFAERVDCHAGVTALTAVLRDLAG